MITLERPIRAARAACSVMKPKSSQASQAEDDSRGFFTQALGLLCIAGFDGYFMRLNRAWETALGWTIKELTDLPFIEFIHPDDHAATLAAMDELRRGAQKVRFANRYRCRDGSLKWLEWDAVSLPDRGQVYAIARDISVRRSLEKEVLETRDREKDRLGRELHDGLCQNLAGIAALGTALSRKLARNSESTAAAALEITRLLNETIGHARDMARGLNPVNLEQIGVGAALESLALNVESLFQVSCNLRCHPDFPRLRSDVEMHLYRTAQEAVSNAITHGRSRHLKIDLGLRGAEGLLSIQDDGTGVPEDPMNGHAGKGIGLHTMNYRARLMGGTLKVQANAPRGTRVTCVFGLPECVCKE